ncbi:death-associated inhibitor of apoptosis 1 [Senna tora]|uniref:Death-associated inhibitor of apoptosis 1 n=1 Tax=Senna tora TaxID=362788 RepID=A0A834X9Y7_9FABA|nr:death-associated inhibitor of apoptosis 1 [Senna tora]
MSQLGMILQESLQREREERGRTILGLLTEQMEGVDHTEPRRRRSLKERFRFTGMGCCGATWGFRPAATVRFNEDDDDQEDERRQQQRRLNDPDCVNPVPSGSGMNLAAALAAERQFRGSSQEAEAGSATGNELQRRLLEETEGGEMTVTVTEKEGVGNDTVCCVCMGRKKGAAFIPCGHTFCRVCSRELWLNRGSCPLCNRSIIEILDIF